VLCAKEQHRVLTPVAATVVEVAVAVAVTRAAVVVTCNSSCSRGSG